MADLNKNFDSLRNSGVIPKDQDLNSLPDDVKKAIADLSDDEIAALKKLAASTNSYLAFHGKDGGIVCNAL